MCLMSYTANFSSLTGTLWCPPPHKPEIFFARFDYPEQRDLALWAGSVNVGPSTFLIQPWQL
jgi:hypothetical protein